MHRLFRTLLSSVTLSLVTTCAWAQTPITVRVEVPQSQQDPVAHQVYQAIVQKINASGFMTNSDSTQDSAALRLVMLSTDPMQEGRFTVFSISYQIANPSKQGYPWFAQDNYIRTCLRESVDDCANAVLQTTSQLAQRFGRR